MQQALARVNASTNRNINVGQLLIRQQDHGRIERMDALQKDDLAILAAELLLAENTGRVLKIVLGQTDRFSGGARLQLRVHKRDVEPGRRFEIDLALRGEDLFFLRERGEIVIHRNGMRLGTHRVQH